MIKTKLDIRRAIKEHGKNQVSLCRAIGIEKSTLQIYINGNPTVKSLYKIAEGLDCDVRDLFYPIEDDKNILHLNDGTPVPDYVPIPQVHYCPNCGTKFQIVKS